MANIGPIPIIGQSLCGGKEGVLATKIWQQEEYSNEGVAAKRVRVARVVRQREGVIRKRV